MIHEEICTYEVCKLAKEKGFPQDVFGTCEMKSPCYLIDGRYYKDWCICPIEEAYTAPTQSLLQRWLREEKGIMIGITIWLQSDGSWRYRYKIQTKEDDISTWIDYSTYELALEDVLKYTLENLV